MGYTPILVAVALVARRVALSALFLMISFALSVAAADPAQASDDVDDMQSCIELADRAIGAAQRALDPERSATEQVEARTEYEHLVSLVDSVSMVNLGAWDEESESGRLCFSGEFYRLLCARAPALEAAGSPGDELIAGILAPCLPGVDYSADYTNAPFPTLEQFEAAANCEERGRLLAGVENEEFRRAAELTDVNEVEGDFAEYWSALARLEQDPESRLQCEGADHEITRIAADQRCRAWAAAGHGIDEDDPPLINTRRCFDELLAAGSSEGLSAGTVVFFGIPILLLLSSPFTAFINFRKGRPIQGWMGSIAIPAVGILFLGVRAWVSGQDLDFATGIAVGMMVLALFATIGGGLTIGSLVGALGAAAPDSTWAQKRYDEEKMTRARLKRARREGVVLPPPPSGTQG